MLTKARPFFYGTSWWTMKPSCGFIFLADIIPMPTRMDVLFQATLPLPHLLCEKAQGAKDEIKFMFGQEPRDGILSTADLDADTRFGPATESFLMDAKREGKNMAKGGGCCARAKFRI